MTMHSASEVLAVDLCCAEMMAEAIRLRETFPLGTLVDVQAESGARIRTRTRSNVFPVTSDDGVFWALFVQGLTGAFATHRVMRILSVLIAALLVVACGAERPPMKMHGADELSAALVAEVVAHVNAAAGCSVLADEEGDIVAVASEQAIRFQRQLPGEIILGLYLTPLPVSYERKQAIVLHEVGRQLGLEPEDGTVMDRTITRLPLDEASVALVQMLDEHGVLGCTAVRQ